MQDLPRDLITYFLRLHLSNALSKDSFKWTKALFLNKSYLQCRFTLSDHWCELLEWW